MACTVGNITRLFTRNCYAAIECRSFWDQPLHVPPEVRHELSFRLNNTDSISGKVMSPKSSAVGVVYSDAIDSGFGGYFVQCGLDLMSGVWSHEEMRSSSTFREILAVNFVLLSLVNQLSGLTVKWFTDNQNVPRIISSGSSKEHLQSEALSIFSICCSHGISIEMEWIRQDPRMTRLIFSVVFLIQTTGAFLHFRFTTLTRFGVLILLIVSQIM